MCKRYGTNTDTDTDTNTDKRHVQNFSGAKMIPIFFILMGYDSIDTTLGSVISRHDMPSELTILFLWMRGKASRVVLFSFSLFFILILVFFYLRLGLRLRNKQATKVKMRFEYRWVLYSWSMLQHRSCSYSSLTWDLIKLVSWHLRALLHVRLGWITWIWIRFTLIPGNSDETFFKWPASFFSASGSLVDGLTSSKLLNPMSYVFLYSETHATATRYTHTCNGYHIHAHTRRFRTNWRTHAKKKTVHNVHTHHRFLDMLCLDLYLS